MMTMRLRRRRKTRTLYAAVHRLLNSAHFHLLLLRPFKSPITDMGIIELCLLG